MLARAPGLRDRMVLATKGGIVPPVPYDSSPAALRAACEASLRRLQVDVIDLYQVHRPDLFAHPADVAETLLALRSEGKIRAIGVSNHTAAQHRALEAHLGEPLATSQPELSVAHLEPVRDGVLDHCMATGVGAARMVAARRRDPRRAAPARPLGWSTCSTGWPSARGWGAPTWPSRSCSPTPPVPSRSSGARTRTGSQRHRLRSA